MSEHGVTVSIKPTGGYDATMLVFKGKDTDEVEEHLIDFFGLDTESVTDQTVFELVAECDALAKATYAASEALGAKPSRDTRKPLQGPQKPAQALPEHVWATVLQGIADAKTTAEIARLYALNKEAWTDPDVQAAAKNKSEELA